MPLAAMALVTADVNGAGFATTLDVSNRTEARLRATQGAPPPNPSLDLVDVPTARLVASNRRWQYTLGYSATGLWPNAQTGAAPQLLQAADLGASWHDRRATVTLSESGSYGQQNSAYFLGPATGSTPAPVVTPAGGGVQPLTVPVTVNFGSSRTALSTNLVLSRRWNASVTIDYTIAGGIDATSRTVMPLVREPRAQATADYAVTRRDTLETSAAVLRGDSTAAPCSPIIETLPTTATCQPTVQEGQIEESWTHRLTRTTEGSLGGGASLVNVRLRPADPYVDTVYPFARAGVVHTEGTLVNARRLSFEALLAPVLDVRTGILDERVQGTIAATVPLPEERLTFDGTIAAARSVESRLVQPVTYLQASVEADYRLSAVATVGVGVRYAWQNQTGVGSFSGEMLFAQLTLHAPTMRF